MTNATIIAAINAMIYAVIYAMINAMIYAKINAMIYALMQIWHGSSVLIMPSFGTYHSFFNFVVYFSSCILAKKSLGTAKNKSIK